MNNYMPSNGWKNMHNTSDRRCRCGSWENHWLNFSDKPWPSYCSVNGCYHPSTLGAHVFNPAVAGEQIVPMCDSCNHIEGYFSLKDGTTLVPANKSITCEK